MTALAMAVEAPVLPDGPGLNPIHPERGHVLPEMPWSFVDRVTSLLLRHFPGEDARHVNIAVGSYGMVARALNLEAEGKGGRNEHVRALLNSPTLARRLRAGLEACERLRRTIEGAGMTGTLSAQVAGVAQILTEASDELDGVLPANGDAVPVQRRSAP
jgi:hypothetical protein